MDYIKINVFIWIISLIKMSDCHSEDNFLNYYFKISLDVWRVGVDLLNHEIVI